MNPSVAFLVVVLAAVAQAQPSPQAVLYSPPAYAGVPAYAAAPAYQLTRAFAAAPVVAYAPVPRVAPTGVAYSSIHGSSYTNSYAAPPTYDRSYFY